MPGQGTHHLQADPGATAPVATGKPPATDRLRPAILVQPERRNAGADGNHCAGKPFGRREQGAIAVADNGDLGEIGQALFERDNALRQTVSSDPDADTGLLRIRRDAFGDLLPDATNGCFGRVDAEG